MDAFSKLNSELSDKIALYQTSKSVSDLTAIELVGMAFLRGEDSLNIWKEYRRNINDDVMRKIAETEFEELISEITKE